jgi:hypothetical protein
VRDDFGLRHRQRRDVLGHPTHRRHLVKTRDHHCAHAQGFDLAKIFRRENKSHSDMMPITSPTNSY